MNVDVTYNNFTLPFDLVFNSSFPSYSQYSFFENCCSLRYVRAKKRYRGEKVSIASHSLSAFATRYLKFSSNPMTTPPLVPSLLIQVSSLSL